MIQVWLLKIGAIGAKGRVDLKEGINIERRNTPPGTGCKMEKEDIEGSEFWGCSLEGGDQVTVGAENCFQCGSTEVRITTPGFARQAANDGQKGFRGRNGSSPQQREKLRRLESMKERIEKCTKGWERMSSGERGEKELIGRLAPPPEEAQGGYPTNPSSEESFAKSQK